MSSLSRTQRRVAALSEQELALRSQNVALEEHILARTEEAEELAPMPSVNGPGSRRCCRIPTTGSASVLATVSSLLGLQLARTGSAEVRNALEAADPVQAIASGHRRLRLGADLETTNAAEFLDHVIDDLAASVPAGKQVAFVRRLSRSSFRVMRRPSASWSANSSPTR